jgi:DNA-binding IclR family transcriptional regulator
MSATDEQGKRASGVQVINRAAEILRLLQTSSTGMTQVEIAGKLSLARTTVHRILGALEEEGFVTTGQGGARPRYRLGGEIPRLASAVRRQLIDQMHPLLQALSRATDETADLSVLDNNQVTFIDQVVAPHRLRAVSAIGDSFPVHCTANGKAMLAQLPPARLHQLIRTLPALTSRTITDKAALLAELDEIRETGVAYDREEHHEGICAVGVVVSADGDDFVAISIPMPAQRFYGRENILRTTVLDTLAEAGVPVATTGSTPAAARS